MKLTSVSLRNFRCYEAETRLEVVEFTTIIGANDIGKSTLLDALAIFFGVAKPDDKDACVTGDRTDMNIACTFDDLPASIMIDATNRTTLQDEYLLNADGQLEIHHTFNGTLKAPKAKIAIYAVHPSVEGAKDLLSLKRVQLKDRCRDLGVDLEDVNQNVNAELRAAIRNHLGALEPELQEIKVDQDGAKELFPKIREQLPGFFLFRVDRPSTDQDAEAQDPMKAAVRLALDGQRDALGGIADSVLAEVTEMARRTLDRLRVLAPEVAAELRPEIADPKWDSVFKIGLHSNSGIPLNKRGSGVRRLVLLAFLQAQVESHRNESPDRGIIYAIEEPETSQHPDTQRALLEALREIAQDSGFQVIMTTHTPNLVRLLPAKSLRFVQSSNDGIRAILSGDSDETKELIRKTLGVHPDHDVRLFLGVEGINDEHFLRRISAMLARHNEEIESLDDLVDSGRVIFIPVGGSSLTYWVARLKNLRCREFYLLDRDNPPPQEPHYVEFADRVNAREDCEAVHTSKRELESYLHRDAINAVIPEFESTDIGDFDDVPVLVAREVHRASESSVEWAALEPRRQRSKVSAAKKRLNTFAVEKMTVELLAESDPEGDISSWLKRITEIASGD